jgi:carboxyl-terminal processing protease
MAIVQTSMKSLIRVKWGFAATLLLGLVSSGFAQDTSATATEKKPPELTAEQKASVIKGVEDTLFNKAFVPGVDFKKWPEFVEKRKESIEKAESIDEFNRVINQALRDFGISHCRLMTPRTASRRNRTTDIGAGLMGTASEEGLVVRRVADSGPGKAAGVEEKDVITKLNGEKPKSFDQLSGEKGTKLSLEVKKPDGKVVNIEITLDTFSTVRKETLTWHGEDTAVLRVFTFSAGYDRENIESLVKQANAKAKNLILDLRSNGGGAINNLSHLLSLLLPTNTEFGTYVSKRFVDDFVKAKPEATVTPEAVAEWAPRKAKTRSQKTPAFTGKIAVLINRGSGSASEICAAALNEIANAPLVGTKSAGAVLTSTYEKLPEGFQMQYPVSDYITIKGRRLEANPLVPTHEITAVRGENGVDPVVEKAIEALKQSKN